MRDKHKGVLQLYPYLSVVFVYCYFDIQISIEAVREAYENSINDAGINLAEGALVWNAYRSFENTLLEVLEEAGSRNLERLYVLIYTHKCC